MIITFIFKYWNFKCRKSAITSHTDIYLYRDTNIFTINFLWWRGKKTEMVGNLFSDSDLDLNLDLDLASLYPWWIWKHELEFYAQYLICLSDQWWHSWPLLSLITMRINNNLFGNPPCQYYGFTFKWNKVFWKTRPTQIRCRNYARTQRKISVMAKHCQLLVKASEYLKRKLPRLPLCKNILIIWKEKKTSLFFAFLVDIFIIWDASKLRLPWNVNSFRYIEKIMIPKIQNVPNTRKCNNLKVISKCTD